jgi:HEXXH motif-containing protein
LITTHRLPQEAFEALAHGGGDPVAVRHLCEAQHSKHLMLLHAVAEAADGADPASPAVVAFRTGYKLLATVQAADPGAVAWLLALPHMGGWAHDCLIRLGQGLPPDFGYLACAAAAAAVRAGVGFELDVPVSEGRVLLPGLGCLQDIDERTWVRLRSDGERLSAGALVEVPCAALVPDDGSGSGGPVPHWRGTVLVRAVAEGHAWDVLLETADRHLDRYALPMCAAATAEEVTSWRRRIQSAWQVLVRHHGWASGPIAEGVSVIVPLAARSDTDLDSATAPAAFGAIATSWPPDPVTMAETLVHEFQHLKLCGLMDMVHFIEPGSEKVYAPWRPDPRPAGGLLQGVYAFLGVARFWNAQRHAETDPDDILRAQVTYERWRPAIELAADTLLRTGCLTPAGTRFVSVLRDSGRSLESETVPVGAREIAGEAALDHWLTWQLRHMTTDATAVADLAAAYRRGEPLGDQTMPAVRIEEETRKADSTIRSRLLDMRYLDPPRYRELCAAGVPGLSEADVLLVNGKASQAVQAYRDEIVAAADGQPDAWSGLALAVHRMAPTPLRHAFATQLPLMFDVHACLRGQGVWSDPLDLAAWFV